jgi:peptide/nickel transport system substrate-binding protein
MPKDDRYPSITRGRFEPSLDPATRLALDTWSRRRFLKAAGTGGGALLAGGGLLGLAEACTSGQQSTTRNTNQKLSVAVFQNFDSLDPGVGGLLSSYQVCLAVFDPLIWHFPGHGSTEYFPGLAESFSVNSDATVYTFKLKKNIKFHDGTPFDGNAVKVSFDHVVDPSTKSRAAVGQLGPYQETRVIDPYTVEVHFKVPHAAFVNEMTGAYMGISSPTALAKYGAEYGQHPVGTGAFIFKEFVDNQHVTVTRNPDYNWGPAVLGNSGPPHLSELTFRVLPDPAAQYNALATGEIQIAQSLSSQDVVRALQDARFKKLEADSTGMGYDIMVNVTKAPTDDINVRKALQFATDQSAIVKTLFKGLYQPATSIFTTTTPGYDKSQNMYPHDPAKAAALLDRAGWTKSPDGTRRKGSQALSLEFINITGFGFDDIAQLMQAQFKQVGIATTISSQSFPTVADTYNQGKHNLADFFYYDVDPYFTLALFGCDFIKSGYNWEHYCDNSLDAKINAANATADAKARSDKYKDIGRILMDQAVVIPIYDLRGIFVMPKNVNGLAFTVNAEPVFHAVSLS